MEERDHLQIVNDESEADDDYFGGGYLGDCGYDDDDGGYDYFDYDLRTIHCSLWNHRRHRQKTNQKLAWFFDVLSVVP